MKFIKHFSIFAAITFVLAIGAQGQSVTKTYAPGFSTTMDGCGTYCSTLAGVTFNAGDFNTSQTSIMDVNITINWAKTDGTCTAPGIGNSYHEESNFRLDGPSGTQVVLAPTNTWTGNATIAAINTEFNDSASNTPSGTPVSGSFLPSTGDLDDFFSESPEGVWYLRAGDTNAGAPLCVASYSVTVRGVPKLKADAINFADVSCFGTLDGVATVTASGGTPPYSYSWSNGASVPSISGLSAGMYNVTVTDSEGLVDSDTVTINEPDTLIATSAVDAHISCYGFADGSATAAATGGTTPYSYLWSHGPSASSVSSLDSGMYSVTVTDSKGCTSADSVLIEEPELLVVSMADSAFIPSEFLTTTSISAPSGYDSYLWSTGSLSSETFVSGEGWYFVTITDSNGCSAMDSIYVATTVGVYDLVAKPSVTVYPNPANNEINVVIESNEVPEEISIISIDGSLIISYQNTATVGVSQLTSGLYMLIIIHGENTWFKRLVIE